MSAKPQPMAGQSDPTNDLINELARLMQQDADASAPAEPVRSPFSVRIPGGDEAPPAAQPPRFDFQRAAEPAAAAPSRPAPAPEARPAAVDDTPEPFKFDFDVALPKRGATEPSAIPSSAVPRPSPIAERRVAEPKPAPVDDHDSIADLIAAELLADAPVVGNATQPVAPRPATLAAQSHNPADTQWQDEPFTPHNHDFDVQPPAASDKPEQDRFSVAPVFGLGVTPTRVEPDLTPLMPLPPEPVPTAPVLASLAPTEPRPAPAARPATPTPVETPADDNIGRDPIDEIESLIGRAMRVELDGKPEPVEPTERPAPSPALRSLATPIAPAAPAKPPRSEIASADDAILAAAQATGVDIDWVEGPDLADEPATVARKRAPRSFRLTRSVAGPLVAIVLLLAAGFGLYMVLGLGQESGPAPLLTADTSPVKETPPPAPDSSAQQSVVFNEIDGVVPGAEEQLVSRDQTDLNEVTQIPPTSDVSEEGLANRKVRTVTVRPDGTIVSGEDSVAGSSILPVARPVVPEIPGAETASPELLASATTPVTQPTPEPVAPAVTVVPVTPGSTVPAVDLAGNALAGKTAPVPLLRPSGLVASTAPTSPVNAVVDTPVSTGNSLPPAPVATTPVTAEAPAAPTSSAPAYVQLASQRTEAEARTTAQAMVTRFGPLFGGANMEVQRVDLGTRGIYYRVRVPANSLQDANTICTNVKAAGGDCFTM